LDFFWLVGCLRSSSSCFLMLAASQARDDPGIYAPPVPRAFIANATCVGHPAREDKVVGIGFFALPAKISCLLTFLALLLLHCLQH
jgi:hypothetical protein